MFVVGLTGGIGSGKTTVAQLFSAINEGQRDRVLKSAEAHGLFLTNILYPDLKLDNRLPFGYQTSSWNRII